MKHPNGIKIVDELNKTPDITRKITELEKKKLDDPTQNSSDIDSQIKKLQEYAEENAVHVAIQIGLSEKNISMLKLIEENFPRSP